MQATLDTSLTAEPCHVMSELDESDQTLIRSSLLNSPSVEASNHIHPNGNMEC